MSVTTNCIICPFDNRCNLNHEGDCAERSLTENMRLVNERLLDKTDGHHDIGVVPHEVLVVLMKGTTSLDNLVSAVLYWIGWEERTV